MYEIAKKTGNRYCNYMAYAIKLVGEGDCLQAECMYLPLTEDSEENAPVGKFAEAVTFAFENEKTGSRYTLKDFGSVETEYEISFIHTPEDIGEWSRLGPRGVLKILLNDGPVDLPQAVVRLWAKRDAVCFWANTDDKGYVLVTSGRMVFGGKACDSVCAVALDRVKTERDWRVSYGPAASKIDDALFDRDSDRALRLVADKRRIHYDFEKKQYCFNVRGEFSLQVEEHVFERRFYVKYKGINKNNTFPTPPSGWMTWYAVKFNASETAVLENAVKQKELFGEYGADTIWVDWEWYHFDQQGKGKNGVHFFAPDPVRYPNGLDYVAEKIKELGFVPALWVGPTNEPTFTDFMMENEHSVYADKTVWCGSYFFDLTNKAYLEEFVPQAFHKVKEWGYEALKWDCLPVTLEFADQFHAYMADPSLSSVQALRRVVKAARDIVGENFYMLSCSGERDLAVLFAGDIFDGARIGGDIFTWQEFIENFLERILRHYVYHNNMFYCDPDNLVIRPEFNNYDQAVTRTSFVSLLGLPLTLGDDLRDLPQDRVELIRRALPTLDIRPMDIREMEEHGDYVIVNLQIAKPFEEWNVVQVSNLLTEEHTVIVDFDSDLHLENGSYLVYDYWQRAFLGKKEGSIALTLPAYGSAVLSVRRCNGGRQIVSTSRHISQGGFDLLDVQMDAEGMLCGCSKVVAGEPYVITVYDPKTQSVFEHTLYPETTGELKWRI